MEISRAAGALSLAVLFVLLVFAASGFQEFGQFENRRVAEYYLREGLELTGSANIVNAIVWDFRGYDTLGEETVLFCAALGVFLVVSGKRYGRNN
jgi:multisubunit Na+/H+ antiporter MnhB subunit